jgi:putative heme iron utilization protein
MSDAKMTQHAGGGPSPTPNVPEPSFAEQARTLMHLGRCGMLATQLRRHAGFPFGSIAPYGLDAQGQPTLLFSTMAVHTQNLLADPHASLLVTQPGWTDDPLAGARLTLVGPVVAVGGDELNTVRADYLQRHENARYWVDFGDFGFYRMAVEDAYYVAGFGAMGWVTADAYRDAQPDPLADAAAGILAHMNDDHTDALVLYCAVFAGVDATQATMTAIDRMGFRVRARSGDRLQGLRINFPREVRTPMDARTVLVEMVRTAREQKAVSGSAPR